MQTFAPRSGPAGLLLAALMLSAGCASSASSPAADDAPPPPAPTPDTVYTQADPMPRPLNYREVLARLRFPAADTAGSVRVQFVVTEDGRIAAPEITEPLHPALDGEALRVVRFLRFEPGRRAGAPAAVRMAVPIRFEARNPKELNEIVVLDEVVDEPPMLVGEKMHQRMDLPARRMSTGLHVMVAELIVTPQGETQKLKVVRSGGRPFDVAALAALSEARFEPARRDGQPVAARITFPVRVSLHEIKVTVPAGTKTPYRVDQ